MKGTLLETTQRKRSDNSNHLEDNILETHDHYYKANLFVEWNIYELQETIHRMEKMEAEAKCITICQSPPSRAPSIR
jgi:hypothetical protein